MKRVLIAVSLIALLCHTGCETKHEHKKEETKFLVTRPARKDTSITREYVCQIHAIQHIELRVLEGGYLEKTFVDEGQLVEKGQLMFQIMPVILQAELQKAQAEAEMAKIEYLNTKSLADNKVVSPNELAMSQARLDKATAEQALAQARLDFMEIRAPFDGLMGRFRVRLGSLLEEGELLTTLSDNSEMWVYFNVPEAEYLNYKKRTKDDSPVEVKLLMANNRLFEYPGVVTAIEADFNNETGNIAFRTTFPNPEGLLRHGETGNIQMTDLLTNALLIPQKTTFEILDKKYVFVIDENHVVRSRHITIGEEMPHIYVVTDGLTESDKILLEGLRKVRDKDVITYEFQEPDSVMADLELYAE
ncbi:MAG: efflux RND transporter periplasmic adaptor subunit [Candidatus Scalindua sp. AMX11]|nr:MAG: efflux RND transporter periplasmic adaptor subunit [Candidatus Scalindua sp.]NOG83432.1 efflux RND transporter periplasmic adaptor subunit [Planctomycetota bacterium]RZV75098.1 MAG: efflux RND transporter periplasmic adaptor subunit [Candidatus Scalindua sp. SCAELEC01]TDE64350.1 MAG: efflux RND transporter periplasmic adaptor subunit [Candidatus Scalindua sp. AMX11]GJQ60622.1 MAG: hemolysin D [Candidatus Scalindua sp.]